MPMPTAGLPDSASDGGPDLAGACLLWDIDGTLIEHAPSARDRHAHAAGLVLKVPTTPVPAGTGKTDRQIICEIIAMHAEPADELVDDALAHLDRITAEELESSPTTAMAGVADLLEALAPLPLTHFLLTGNTPRRAELKVWSAGLGSSFPRDDGFYGDRHSTRFDLVAEAATRLGANPANRPVIIGDTPLDIAAARSAGIPVISVATGTSTERELAALGPDALLADFSGGTDAFLEALRSALA